MPAVLAFDIGIKNLAYCVLSADKEILAWENVNLLSLDASGAQIAAPTFRCHACKAKPSWIVAATATAVTVPQRNYCKRHLPASHPPLTDLSGAPIKKIPAVAALKELVAAAGLAPTAAKKKDDLLQLLGTKYALPFLAVNKAAAPRVKKATETGLEDIHDSIIRMIDGRTSAFAPCTTVLLENQPVFKNPTMKSVQIMLFSTLRDNYIRCEEADTPVPTFHFVHAGKKVKGAAKGDAGYAARKDGGEARVREWLAASPTRATWSRLFEAAPKKSDLADALCMCLDWASASAATATAAPS
jgi:hypothetical protein